MRSFQDDTRQELGFVLALPLCYCLPGYGQEIVLNIKNSNFDFKLLDFTVDRYIIDSVTPSIAIGSIYDGTAGSSGYRSGIYTNHRTQGGAGSGLTVNFMCNTTNGILTNIRIQNHGRGYLPGDTVTIVGGDATVTLKTERNYGDKYLVFKNNEVTL
jgi:hypothetical protein